MPNTTTQFEILFRSLILTVSILCIFAGNSFSQATYKNPERGIQAGSSYSISDIENINTTNGNLILNIPLVSLPKGRGQIGQGISLQYNSKLYDTNVQQTLDESGKQTNQNMLGMSLDGGWKYVTNTYSLDVSSRFETSPPIDCNGGEDGKRSFIWKVQMQLPDGSKREFRPTGYNDNYDDGFFTVNANGYETHGCSTPSTVLVDSDGMTYYSTDGSYSRLIVDHVSDPANIGEYNSWTMSMPDGSKVTGGGGNPTRLYDRNGNYIEGNINASNQIADMFGRSISVGENPVVPDEDLVSMHGVGGTILTWRVKWKHITLQKSYRTTGANSGDTRGGTSIQSISGDAKVVDRITLPPELGSLYYEFNYNSEQGGDGWGEISSVRIPSGAIVNYQFTTPYGSGFLPPEQQVNTGTVLRNYPSTKTLTYLAENDGNSIPVTETTNYSILKTSSTVTGPDGLSTYSQYGDSSYENQSSGVVWKTSSSNGNVTEKLWAFNRPTGANPNARINPYVKTEFTTIADANGNPSLTAIKDITLDPNGNQMQVTEYDWVAYGTIPRDGLGKPSGIPASAVVKRTTTTGFYNTVAENPGNAYWAQASPSVRSAVKTSEVKDHAGAVKSRSEITYDNAATTANPNQTRSWDSSKGTYSDPLTVANSISATVQYNSYGMPTQTTDAKGNITQVTYGAVGGYYDLYPTQTVTAYGTSVARTSSAAYDLSTGLVTMATDVDDNLSVATVYDTVGRPIKVRSAANTSLESWVQTEYDDVNRRVIVRADLEALGDGKRVAVQFYDQMGRVRLSKTLEDAATQSATNETDGIKVQTRYLTGNPYSYQLTSNPYRAPYSYSGTDATMGWSRNLTANTGRHSETETFSGSTLPAPWGSNPAATGKVQTDIDANATTITDQAGKQRRSVTNALGQLARVDEPTASGLGPVTAPYQPTYYSYNTLGKMVRVQQGVQNRYFMYDSLGRTLRVRQPEQEVNAGLNTSGDPLNNSWTAGFTYDNNGNVLTTTDAKGVTITNTYDALNRPVTRSYNDGITPAVTNYYDGNGVSPFPQYAKGKLTKVSSSVSESKYTQFDVAGRLLQSQQVTDGQTYTSSYQYNLSGALTQETYPSGRVVKNEFDASGDISRIFGNPTVGAPEQTYANSFGYFPDGKIEKLKLGNNLWELAKLNSRLQVTELSVGSTPGDGSLMKLVYDYGELQADGVSVDPTKNAGNIAKQTVSFNGLANPFVQTYKYDSLDRITEAVEKVNYNQTWKQTFGYDIYGNRNARYQIIGSTTMPINSVTLPSVDQYSNRFTGGQGYSYDKNGNILNDLDPATSQNRTFTFNGDNKQTQVTDTTSGQVKGTYFYDGNARRVKKVTETETTIFVYNGMGNLVAEYSTATPSANPTIHYTATDTLGSPRLITNAQGQVESRRDFLPFGEELYADGTYRKTADKYSTTGQDAVRQRFTGYQRDTETSLDFAEARYYQNAHGRFTAVDPLLTSGKSANPQTFNRYLYVMNNPIILSDPSGLQAGTDDGVLHCKGAPENCNATYNKDSNTITGKYGDLIDQTVEVSAGLPSWALRDSSRSGLSLGCPPGAQCGSSAPTGPDLDITNAEPLKSVEGIARISELGSLLPVVGTPFAAIGAAVRFGQGDAADGGINLLGGIPTFGALAKIGKTAKLADEAAEASHVVYQGINPTTKAVEYVGITMRNPNIRFGEHVANGLNLDFRAVEGAAGLTKIQARIWEQNLILQHGLQKNGGSLLNKINSIAPKYWPKFGIRP